MEDPEKLSRVQAMIDGKVASLQKQLNPLSRPASTIYTASSSSSRVKMMRAEAGPPPPNANHDEIDPCRIWVGGFPRATLESHRRNHFEA
eukprot:3982760-Pyramimonas_sp.AAC.1